MSAPTVATMVAAVFVGYVYRSLPAKPKTAPHRPKEILDALDRNEDVFYFGVGSNLSRTRLESRGICGKKIHPISMEPCVIHHCRLAFNFKWSPPLEPCFGSLEPLPSFYEQKDAKADHPTIVQRSDSKPLLLYREPECHGALIKISSHDYELVHKSEGGGMGANSGYEEIMVDCVPYDKSKPAVRAVAYRGREHTRLARDSCPSKRYMDIIRKGAAELCLAKSYQQWLNEYPVQRPPGLVLRMVAKYSMVFTFTLSLGLNIHVIESIQTLLLFQVYVLPTEPRWKQIIGEIAAIAIMIPTACLGLALRKVLERTGLMPPEMITWMKYLDRR